MLVYLKRNKQKKIRKQNLEFFHDALDARECFLNSGMHERKSQRKKERKEREKRKRDKERESEAEAFLAQPFEDTQEKKKTIGTRHFSSSLSLVPVFYLILLRKRSVSFSCPLDHPLALNTFYITSEPLCIMQATQIVC